MLSIEDAVCLVLGLAHHAVLNGLYKGFILGKVPHFQVNLSVLLVQLMQDDWQFHPIDFDQFNIFHLYPVTISLYFRRLFFRLFQLFHLFGLFLEFLRIVRLLLNDLRISNRFAEFIIVLNSIDSLLISILSGRLGLLFGWLFFGLRKYLFPIIEIIVQQ